MSTGSYANPKEHKNDGAFGWEGFLPTFAALVRLTPIFVICVNSSDDTSKSSAIFYPLSPVRKVPWGPMRFQ